MIDLDKWAGDDQTRLCLLRVLRAIDPKAWVQDDLRRFLGTRFLVIDAHGDARGSGREFVDEAIADACCEIASRAIDERDEAEHVLRTLGKALDGLHKWCNPESDG